MDRGRRRAPQSAVLARSDAEEGGDAPDVREEERGVRRVVCDRGRVVLHRRVYVIERGGEGIVEDDLEVDDVAHRVAHPALVGAGADVDVTEEARRDQAAPELEPRARQQHRQHARQYELLEEAKELKVPILRVVRVEEQRLVRDEVGALPRAEAERGQPKRQARRDDAVEDEADEGDRQSATLLRHDIGVGAHNAHHCPLGRES